MIEVDTLGPFEVRVRAPGLVELDRPNEVWVRERSLPIFVELKRDGLWTSS